MLGLRAIPGLDIRQHPETSSSVITISTPYPGTAGIDFIDRSRVKGFSTISMIRAYLALIFNPDDAIAQELTKVNSVRNDLPEVRENAVVSVSSGAGAASSTCPSPA